ncbi:hypothetical protein TNCV_40971 [Trichonephila clavipes]|nr:hypothetical protein TNCV_40971 [Trichonephila clavipes]
MTTTFLIGKPQVVPFPSKWIESSKQLLVGLQVDTSGGLSFNLGRKFARIVLNAIWYRQLQIIFLFCAGLEREGHLFQSSFGVRFSEDSWAHGPGLACG